MCLCLCFKLEDECESIFARLQAEGDWTVLSLLDARGEVIFSSDGYQMPVGARLAGAHDENSNIVRFAGREFLGVTCKAQPYQGYAGPAWRGHVMIPLERAFEAQAAKRATHVRAPRCWRICAQPRRSFPPRCARSRGRPMRSSAI